MKLTFYCPTCITEGRTGTMRWSNLEHFLNHISASHPRVWVPGSPLKGASDE